MQRKQGDGKASKIGERETQGKPHKWVEEARQEAGRWEVAMRYRCGEAVQGETRSGRETGTNNGTRG